VFSSLGFSPISTWSAHWLAHPEFSDAIERYLDEEGRHIDRYIDAVDARTPYKNEGHDS
jgi:predicted N-acyltransferase